MNNVRFMTHCLCCVQRDRRYGRNRVREVDRGSIRRSDSSTQWEGPSQLIMVVGGWA